MVFSLFRRLLVILLILILILNTSVEKIYAVTEKNEKDKYESEAVVLMDGSTGKILYSKNETKELRPASITKIMTLLLIFEALGSGKINLGDMVSISEHAASMGGSQVYLEPGETQSVDTLIKCISISSANDASVAMAEYISGSEEEFVAEMNRRATELNMNNTHFINCYGLDEDDHFSCALDVALMSRALIMNYPEISTYSCTWMDTFVHSTKRGEETFGLTNTNKLIKSFNGITGLKTGSTSLAKYCLSATAKRNGMDLIAVIMAAPTTKQRFAEAAALLNYGFANYKLFIDDNDDIILNDIKVDNGKTDKLSVRLSGDFSYLIESSADTSKISKNIICIDKVNAPVLEGSELGRIEYSLDGKVIGDIKLLADISIEKASFIDCLKNAIRIFIGFRS